jgi:hypothetical protein
MYVAGTVMEWEKWTGRRFDSDGKYAIEGALLPIIIDLKEDIGIYVEPNVWMVHEVV